MHAEYYEIQDLAEATYNVHSSYKQIIVITESDAHSYMLQELLKFLYPEITQKVKIFIINELTADPFGKKESTKFSRSQRIKILIDILKAQNLETSLLILLSYKSFIRKTPPTHYLDEKLVTTKIRKNQIIDFSEFKKTLNHLGYERVEMAEILGDFSIHGGNVDLCIANQKYPIRIEFHNNSVESIKSLSLEDQSLVSEIEQLTIYPVSENLKFPENISAIKKNFSTKYRDSSEITTNLDIIIHNFKNEENHFSLSFPTQLENICQFAKSKSEEVFILTTNTVLNKTLEFTKKINEIAKSSPINSFVQEHYPILLTVAEIEELISHHQSKVLCEHDYDMDLIQFAAQLSRQNGIIDKLEYLNQYINNHLKDIENLVFFCYSQTSSNTLTRSLKKILSTECFNIKNVLDIKSRYSTSTVPIAKSFKKFHQLFITEADLFGDIGWDNLENFVYNIVSSSDGLGKPKIHHKMELTFDTGDLVTHSLYGVGKFTSLKTIQFNSLQNESEFVELTYHGNDKLFVPIEQINLLTLYKKNLHDIPDNVSEKLDKLGNNSWWSKKKQKIKQDVFKIASEIVQTKAKRKMKQGTVFEVLNEAYTKFCDKFEYLETVGQIAAINDVINDLSSGKIMDRLICADTGFGKTEVAARAAFIVIYNQSSEVKNAIQDQVVVLTPTILLCQQHFDFFQKRFKDFPDINIQQLSSTINKKRASQTIREIRDGKVNIIIASHSVLSNKIEFKKLSMVIIDEEQRFGVKQKEHLKERYCDAHVLSLSATPIPRTLQNALSGIVNLSIISTPPSERTEVNCTIIRYSKNNIKLALQKELSRGGKAFVVCRFIKEIPKILQDINTILPNQKVVVVHSKIENLEEAVTNFQHGDINIMIATTIIECGIDIPKVDTMIIYNSDAFGIIDLYQLKGRIGRRKEKAYAYFCINNSSDNAKMKKLEIITKMSNKIGSSFSLAAYDMDSRGYGNLLGYKQSGHMKEIGLELYEQMLSEAIEKIEKDSEAANIDVTDDYASAEPITKINIPLDYMIPNCYVKKQAERIELYKKLGCCKNDEELTYFRIELISKYGKIPNPCDNLIYLKRLQNLCTKLSIITVSKSVGSTLLEFSKNTKFTDPAVDFILSHTNIKILPNNKIKFITSNMNDISNDRLVKELTKVLTALYKIWIKT